jgi:hypothetical protein
MAGRAPPVDVRASERIASVTAMTAAPLSLPGIAFIRPALASIVTGAALHDLLIASIVPGPHHR